MFRASLETSPTAAFEALRATGCALLAPAGLQALARSSAETLEPLRSSWDRLPVDQHLRDDGRYRFRRHSCFIIERDGAMTGVAHRAHYQPVDYNALHGGIERWFEPIEPEVLAQASFSSIVASIGQELFALRAAPRWYVEAHQFRIDASAGIGRPTPEGAHRDGVDFVAVILIERSAVKGGETRVFEAEGPHGIRFTMTAPWTTLLLDDARVIHETSPVQPLATGGSHRDTLVLTYRGAGFQSP